METYVAVPVALAVPVPVVVAETDPVLELEDADEVIAT